MKLDKDLVRAILLEIESWPPTQYDMRQVEIEGYDARAIGYHLMLLGEAGLLIVEDAGCIGEDLLFEATRLTYAGHAYVDNVRDPEIWRKTKAAAGKAGSVSLKVLVEIASSLASQAARAAAGLP